MPRLRTYGLDADTIRYANRIRSGSGTILSPQSLQDINDFVLGLKRMNLWEKIICWPMRSIHNAGTGSTVYSLGGIGVCNGVITNSLPWSYIGIIRASSGVINFTNGPIYIANNFVGTFGVVGGLINQSNQRVIGHNASAGGWCVATSSNNTNFVYFDTVKNTVGYNSPVFNNSQKIFFAGMSRNSAGNATNWISCPNTHGNNYTVSTNTPLTGLSTLSTSSYVSCQVNSFFIHINQLIFNANDYANLQNLLEKTLFKGTNLIQR